MSILYHEILLENKEDRLLFLALKKSAYEKIFEEPIGKILLKRNLLKLIVFEEKQEVILQWIN